MAVKDWSSTAASNTTILSGITLDGSTMTPSQVDDAFREMTAQVAAQLGKLGFEGADIASATTTNLANATGWSLDITGTTTITGFGTVDAGQMFMLRFAGALTLTHNATSLILPGAANITTAAGDVAFMKSEGSGNWRCLAYHRASGSPLVGYVPVGAVVPYAGSTAPTGWLLCYGQAVSRTTYADLFAVVSTTYGVGDGSTTFNLPDLRGRVVAGQDDMGGTSANRLTDQTGGLDGDTLGGSGGSETHTLTEAQMPSHTHTGTTSSNGAHTHTLNRVSSNGGGDGMWGNSTVTGTTSTSSNGAHTHTFTTASTGSGAAHNNVQPTIILNYIIRT